MVMRPVIKTRHERGSQCTGPGRFEEVHCLAGSAFSTLTVANDKIDARLLNWLIWEPDNLVKGLVLEVGRDDERAAWQLPKKVAPLLIGNLSQRQLFQDHLDAGYGNVPPQPTVIDQNLPSYTPLCPHPQHRLPRRSWARAHRDRRRIISRIAIRHRLDID